jgi:hypothetical protein
MDVIRDTYGYEFRDLVLFKVRAYNSYGWSLDYSPVNSIGAAVRVVPVAVGTIYINAFETTEEKVAVYWSDLTLSDDRGDSVILSYNL